MDSQPTSEFFVGYGTLALINAGLAQSRQRSGLAWFLLSLLLGPIATLLLVTLASQPPEYLSRPRAKVDAPLSNDR